MNNLSWTLYLAEVIPSLGTAAVIFSGAWGLVCGGILIVWTVAWMDEAAPKPWYGTFITVLSISTAVAVLTPPKETIYLIAGSQAGEYVANTPEAQEILDDIRQIIRMQVAGKAGELTHERTRR
jgi:hypothetical protein